MKCYIIKIGETIKSFSTLKEARFFVHRKKVYCNRHDFGYVKGLCQCYLKKEFTIHSINEKLLEEGKV